MAQVRPLSELVWIRPRGNHDGNISSSFPKLLMETPWGFKPVVMTALVPSDEMATTPWAFCDFVESSEGGVVGFFQVSPPSVVMVSVPGKPTARTIIPSLEAAM